MKKLLVAVCFAFFTAASLAQVNNTGIPTFISDSLDEYITTGMAGWKIPGLAIAIVKDGKVVVMKGYGVSDVKTNAPVDENTLFMIASNSKLFTGTALAQLEYNRKLQLDDKVSKYIPGYTLYDKNTTELVTLRDMLSHRIGTKTFQGDFIFWNGNLGRREIVGRMKLLKPTGIFRQSFGYCNSCFLAAAEAIPVVSGKPWEVYVYDSILMPLGMNNTYMLTQGIDQHRNASKPYTNQYTGVQTELPYDHVDNLGPAGSMVSNVKDMSQWLLMQLDSGRLNGRRVLPWDVLRKTRDINTMLSSRKSTVNPVSFSGYGLGVFVNDYGGKQTYYHTGGAFGFVSNTCFVPETKLGIVILTNNDNQNFFEALRYQILDAYLQRPFVNKSAQQLPRHNSDLDVIAEKTKALTARVKQEQPPLALENYTGTYNNELYGNIEVTKDKGGNFLEVNFEGHNSLRATLKYMDSGEWLLAYKNIGYGVFPVSFKQEKNKPLSIELRVNEFLDFDSYTFVKK